MYTVENFKSKKALKEAVAAGKRVEVFQPGPFGDGKTFNGSVALEGPHFPEPHRWYASATVRDSVIVAVEGVRAAPVARPLPFNATAAQVAEREAARCECENNGDYCRFCQERGK